MMSTYRKGKLAEPTVVGLQDLTFPEASPASHMVATTRREFFFGQWRQSNANHVVDTIPCLLDQSIA